jgi:hypothetical protein
MPRKARRGGDGVSVGTKKFLAQILSFVNGENFKEGFTI